MGQAKQSFLSHLLLHIYYMFVSYTLSLLCNLPSVHNQIAALSPFPTDIIIIKKSVKPTFLLEQNKTKQNKPILFDMSVNLLGDWYSNLKKEGRKNMFLQPLKSWHSPKCLGWMSLEPNGCVFLATEVCWFRMPGVVLYFSFFPFLFLLFLIIAVSHPDLWFIK